MLEMTTPDGAKNLNRIVHAEVSSFNAMHLIVLNEVPVTSALTILFTIVDAIWSGHFKYPLMVVFVCGLDPCTSLHDPTFSRT